MSDPLKAIFGPEVVLDGELYVHGWPLQRINAAVTPVRLAPTEDTLRVEYHVFDIVNFDRSFTERIVDSKTAMLLREMSEAETTSIRHVRTFKANTAGDADRRYAQFVESGYEGMMYRLGDCPYTVPKQQAWNGSYPQGRLRFWSDQTNRTFHLLKRKDWQDDDFVCVGINEGQGKQRGMTGAFVCATSKMLKQEPGSQDRLHQNFSVGSGLTDAERQHYWANPPVGQKIKIKYLCLSESGIPLNPTIQCVNPK